MTWLLSGGVFLALLCAHFHITAAHSLMDVREQKSSDVTPLQINPDASVEGKDPLSGKATLMRHVKDKDVYALDIDAQAALANLMLIGTGTTGLQESERAAIAEGDDAIVRRSKNTRSRTVGTLESSLWPKATQTVHSAVRGANDCDGGTSVPESSCLAAVQSILPSGVTQTRTTLLTDTWEHVPIGCSVQSSGEWGARYNKGTGGENDGSYTLVCTGPKPTEFICATENSNQANQCPECTMSSDCECSGMVKFGYGSDWSKWKRVSGKIECTSAAFGATSSTQGRLCLCGHAVHTAASGDSLCDSGASVDEASCLGAAQRALPENVTQTNKNLIVGPWSHVPTGCSLKADDWTAHYNTAAGGVKNEVYSLVCTGDPSAHLANAGDNQCDSGSSMDQAACLISAQRVLPHMKSQTRKTLVVGGFAHVPPGCSMESGGDWAAHYNTEAGATNNGNYSMVCSAVHASAEKTDQCDRGFSVHESACLGSVQRILPSGSQQGRTTLETGTVSGPAGCSVQSGGISGGNWAAYYNTNTGAGNDGDYTLVCTGL